MPSLRLALLPLLFLASFTLGAPIEGRSGEAYIAPASNGGSQLDQSGGAGEPLNVSKTALNVNPGDDEFLSDYHLWSILT